MPRPIKVRTGMTYSLVCVNKPINNTTVFRSDETLVPKAHKASNWQDIKKQLISIIIIKFVKSSSGIS